MNLESHAECSRGWSARCHNSHGKRCRCACGGQNHGGLKREIAVEGPLPKIAEDAEIQFVRDRNGYTGVLIDGAPLPHAIVRHSPDGFEFGYAGSGPAELALNLLACFVDERHADLLHQEFKRRFVASAMPGVTVSARAIRVWIGTQEV